jgi:hydrogenase expression/formation protein HypE
MQKVLPVGKLPPRLLEALLGSCPAPRSSRVILGPRYGEDAAVIDMGSRYLVAKTDPITLTAERPGWYVVNINANDVASLGARPRWFLATLLLPEGHTTATLARRIFRDIVRACGALGITLCGGHTEITAGLSRPILVGQMLGEVPRGRLVRKESQRPGDLVLLTKGIAIEGTAILARQEYRLLAGKLGKTVVRRAQRLLLNLSVVREALLAARLSGIHAMHDPTEGGLASGLHELARAGKVGLRVWKQKIPMLAETQAFSQILGFDPMGLIASGALLVVASPQAAHRVRRLWSRNKIPSAIIGEVRGKNEGIRIVDEGRERTLRVPARDEIARLLTGMTSSSEAQRDRRKI